MHKFLQVLLLFLLGVLVAALLTTAILGREGLLAMVFGPVDLSPIDLRTLTRKPRPNQYLLCPSHYCAATPDAMSPVYAVPAPVLKDRWLTMLARQPRMVPIAVSADGLQYDFLQRSLLLRFPDTITVRFIPLGETQSTLAIYSRSHYGYADFGVNRRRVTAWLEEIKTGSE